MTNKTLENNPQFEQLFNRITHYIEQAKATVQNSINSSMVHAYWLIGKDIVEQEQAGAHRAEYGQQIIKQLSKRLKIAYGRGFSVANLIDIRRFYSEYRTLFSAKSTTKNVKNQTLSSKLVNYSPNIQLGWSHYRELIYIDRLEARRFYEIEAINNRWSVRELKRQVGSLLYDRLAKSKDKEGLLALAHKGQEINGPSDAIKDPMVLEFLGLPESNLLIESKLEEALINNLQHFLLELGKGFAFIARQKRLTLESDHFYADLVFYHVVLKCYVIIDLKTRPLRHGDISQIQLYVNYFDREIKAADDNPTIGLILCTGKNDTMVKYLLGDDNSKIFASKYQFHLPTEKELEKELQRERKIIDSNAR